MIVGRDVDVATGLNPGMLPHAVISIVKNKAKYGKRFIKHLLALMAVDTRK